MTPRPAARIDPSQALAPHRQAPRPRFRPQVVATVDLDTPPLRDMDMIRLDAACHPLHVLGDLRRHYACPVWLDLPGPHRRRVHSTLTTSEMLIFATAEGFTWVGLNGVTHPAAAEQARRLLHPSIKLVVGIDAPGPIQHGVADLGELADALLLDLEELERNVGVARVWSCIEAGLAAAHHAEMPLFLRGNLLPSMLQIPVPADVQLDAMWRLARQGCGGFVLDDETRRGRYPQDCIDVLRMVSAGPGPARVPGAGARLGGRPAVVDTEDEDRS